MPHAETFFRLLACASIIVVPRFAFATTDGMSCRSENQWFRTVTAGCQYIPKRVTWRAGSNRAISFEEADSLCAKLVVKEVKDWKLPTPDEFKLMMARDPMFRNHLPFSPLVFYWTSDRAMYAPSSEEHVASTRYTAHTVCVHRELLDTGCLTDDKSFETLGGGCADKSSGIVWSQIAPFASVDAIAEAYCKDLNDGGYNDWRLPDFDELLTLPSTGIQKYFDLDPSQYFWSSTPFVEKKVDVRDPGTHAQRYLVHRFHFRRVLKLENHEKTFGLFRHQMGVSLRKEGEPLLNSWNMPDPSPSILNILCVRSLRK